MASSQPRRPSCRERGLGVPQGIAYAILPSLAMWAVIGLALAVIL